MLGPNYERPDVDTPKAFRSEANAAARESLGDLPWWEVFHDDALHDMVRTALENNYDLRIAVTQVEQSRAIAMQVRSQLYPQVTYELEADRGKNAILGGPTLGLGLSPGKTFNSFLGVIDATWELDLWGRIRRLNEAARAQLLASEEAQRGVVVTLVGDVAQAYFELLELDLELQIAHDAVESFQQSYDLFEQRFEGGVGTKLETSRAQASLAAAAATIPDLERLILIKEDQLSVLMGLNPAGIELERTLLEEASPPSIPAGLPSSLLERRPDIRQAEALLRAASANIGVAEAAFFPRIGLTAALGAGSTELNKIASGSRALWSVGVNVAGPIFEGGKLIGAHRQAVAAWEQAGLQYQQAALNAFREVADALASRLKLEAVRIERARAVEAYEVAVAIALDRYRFGKANYLDVIDAQEQLFSARTALAQTRRDQFLAVVQLFKALGGGWTLTEESDGTPALAWTRFVVSPERAAAR
jgi:outer membrane protein, multidrug efflux system